MSTRQELLAEPFGHLRSTSNRRRPRIGLALAIAVSLAIHGFIGGYLWTAKFEPHYRIYEADQATVVTLVPPPPPPQPPKAEKPKPPPSRPKPPPTVHPRPPKITSTLSEIPPLPIPPAVAPPAPILAPVLAPPPPPTPPAPSKPHIITQPAWRRLPSAADMARYYPDQAQRQGIEGKAVLSCTVSKIGGLQGCEVIEEDPRGAGFGAAALKMTPLFAISPMTRDGEPVEGGSVRIPLRFQLSK